MTIHRKMILPPKPQGIGRRPKPSTKNEGKSLGPLHKPSGKKGGGKK